jgi:hypothetical protein
MIRDGKGGIKLTKSELNRLRMWNAQNGFVVGDITTEDEYHRAVIHGLPPHIIDDMLEYFETGSSPMTKKSLDDKHSEIGKSSTTNGDE